MRSIGRSLEWGLWSLLICVAAAWGQEHPASEANAVRAQVVVYRPGIHRDPKLLKPSVYYDDKEVALMYSGRYFTIAIPPGKHRISSSDEHSVVELDAKPGETYYVRIVVVNGAWIRNTFSVERRDASEATKDLADLRPADTSHIRAPDVVSVGTLPAK